MNFTTFDHTPFNTKYTYLIRMFIILNASACILTKLMRSEIFSRRVYVKTLPDELQVYCEKNPGLSNHRRGVFIEEFTNY